LPTISALTPSQPLPISHPEEVPLREVRVENRALPAGFGPFCALPCMPGGCARHLRIVLNMAVLVAGMVVLYWAFGRPFVSAGGAAGQAAGQAPDTPGSAATPAMSARAYAMWRVLAKSWG